MFPATGSRITPAMSDPNRSKAARTASMSLNGRVMVWRATDSGTPGELGRPRVSTPLPAFTSRASECPW